MANEHRTIEVCAALFGAKLAIPCTNMQHNLWKHVVHALLIAKY